MATGDPRSQRNRYPLAAAARPLRLERVEVPKLLANPRSQEEVVPTYDYLCHGCQKGFEVRLTITERAKGHVKCPGCGSKRVPAVEYLAPAPSGDGHHPQDFAEGLIFGARSSSLRT